MKNTDKLVMVIDEIHRKAKTASDVVLTEAKQIIATANEDKLESLQKLADIGFPLAKEVGQSKKDLFELVLAKEKAKWISYYATYYPQKYILRDDMQAICEKYKLLIGSSKDYIGSIPENKQKEILNFKLRKEDYLYYVGFLRVTSQTSQRGKGVIEWIEITKDEYKKKECSEDTMKRTDELLNKSMIGRVSMSPIPDEIMDQNPLTSFSRISKRCFVCNNEYFNIVATPDMFNMQGKVVEGVDIKQKVEWPDPIVLKAVKYGYLIVSVWGQELAIEKARNERNN